MKYWLAALLLGGVLEAVVMPFEAETLSTHTYVVLEVYLPWCPPCKALAKELDALSKRSPEYYFAKLDAETFRSVASQFQVTAFPTLIFFEEGKEVGRHEGFLTQGALERKLHETF